MTQTTAETRPTQGADQYLAEAMSGVRALLERHIASDDEATSGTAPLTAEAQGPLLNRLCEAFHLSEFERDIVLLCAAAELDPAMPALCMAYHDDQRMRWPTFRLAMNILPEAHWSALLADGPLRHWNLIELASGDNLFTSQLRIQEPVLHFLMGVSILDERLRALIEPVACALPALPNSYRIHAETLIDAWKREPRSVVHLQGNAGGGKQALAAAACAALGLSLHRMRASAIPSTNAEREALSRIWDRDAVLGSRALLLHVDNGTPAEWAAASVLADRIRGPVVVVGCGALDLGQKAVVRISVDRPKADEQRALWLRILGEHAANLNGELDTLVAQFGLDVETVFRAGRRVVDTSNGDFSQLIPALWEACRCEARMALDGRAQRIEPRASWQDIVLPQATVEMLHTIAMHVRQQGKVMQRWGFAGQNSRGQGLAALFSGPSGTGKTMAAEVLASELRLDLFHIDLSQVVSKYIGDTEKNLCAIFDAAENSGAILLFDEADALFGKRSEVKDSHDRYANIEVSYLLQRMEAYRGLAILTTNMRAALDTAFLRRIRFVVNFPFPDFALRRGIWERMFPPQAPTSGLDLEKLARLNLPGGNIRNVALNAAFLAAEEDGPVRMEHLLMSARRECTKLEKPLSGAEVGGWA